jgi:hypothetical protein
LSYNFEKEHIIPLALGGNNNFTIDVGRKINNYLGSCIDGKFSNDPIVKLHLLPHNNKGHSNKAPVLRLSKCRINNHPATWTLTKSGSSVYDHIEQKKYDKFSKLDVSFSVDIDIRLRFMCKVALATGFYLFGEQFEKSADTATLRKAMLSENLDKENLDLKMYDNLHKIEDKDNGQINTEQLLFRYIGKSAVLFGHAKGRIIVSVSINGKYIGMVNFKADINTLRLDDDHRCGCMLICNNTVIKKSFWQCIYDMNSELKLVDFDQ